MQRHAFSLVELSIVLVILGLLVGGILAGQSLIKAAALRSHINFHSEFTVAWTTFRGKYLALPGDMKNATAFWGAHATLCPDASAPTPPSGGVGTCNGDGNRKVLWGDGSEAQFVFQQLALAGLGNYVAAQNPHLYIRFGLNRSPNKQSVSFVGANHATYADLYANTAPNGSQIEGNALQTGKVNTTLGHPPRAGVLVPADAWQMDSKMDDGNPTRGNFRASNANPMGDTTWLTCLAASGSDYTYSLGTTDEACRYLLKLP